MKVLYDKFDNVNQAKEFWDNNVIEMLDISFYLADCGLINESKQFCQIFTSQKIMRIITNYKFNFLVIKKFLNIPTVYLSRNEDLNNLNENIKREKPKMVNTTELKEKFNDVINTILKEIEQVKW